MMDDKIIKYLIELRQRLLWCSLLTIFLFLILFYFSQKLFFLLAFPLSHYLPDGNSMIATSLTAPFFIPLKLALITSLLIAMPFYLFHLWAFITPALYSHEKKLVTRLFIPSVILFYLGILFCYSIVLPLIFRFISQVIPNNVALMPDMSLFLDFCLQLFLAFGLAFQVPIVTLVLIASGIITAEKLKKLRPYVIVAAFIIGMLLTPPDVISQILLALPMCALFEAGILFSRFIPNGEKRSETSNTSI